MRNSRFLLVFAAEIPYHTSPDLFPEMSAIIDTLRATLQAAPDSWQCRLALVEALTAESRDEEAAAVLEEVSELPADPSERILAGRAYGMLAPESGLEVFDGILSENPALAGAHLEKARLCVELGRLEKAKQHYYTGASLAPELADAEFEERIGVTESLVSPGPGPADPPEEPLDSGARPEPVPISEPAEPGPTENESFSPEPQALESGTPVSGEPRPEEAVSGEPVSETEGAAPGVPVIPLREALGLPRHSPLVDPESVPDLPPLAFDPAPQRQTPAHLPDEVYREHLHPVELHPKTRPEPVVYDYRAPDDSIFEPTVGDDNIFVGAARDESGAAPDELASQLSRSQKEQAERIAAVERREKTQSFLIAMVTMVALCFLMVLVVTTMPPPPPPQIIASTPLPSQEDALDNQALSKPELQKQPQASPASAMTMDVVAASTYSDVSMPSFDTPGMAPGMAGVGNDFGMSMSFGETGGGGAMFFGGRSSGQRFLFVLDHSASMQPHQIELRNRELERTLKGLRGVRYHVMLFAGGVYFVDKGWQAKKKQPTKYPTVFESPDGDYRFESNGLFDFKLVGDEKDFPAPRWLTATPSNVRRSIESVKSAKQFGGTDWDTALEIAHLMDPPPDVIFFMSDGMDREMNPSQIVRNSRGSGAPKINCVAMQTKGGMKAFAEIARRTNGSYTIVDKDGEPIDGFRFKRNPDEFSGRL